MQKKSKAQNSNKQDAIGILGQVIAYLQLLIPATLARRLVSVILLAAGISVKETAKMAGLSERSIWSLKSRMEKMSVADLMVIRSGSGRKAKTANVEEQIVAELENGNYHTRQQIVDMVQDKFGIKVSRSAIGNLLKKRHKVVEVRLCAG